jgi:hypothetical protein
MNLPAKRSPEVLDEAAARDLANKVKAGLDEVRDAIIQLREGRGWLVLGFSSWEDLCAAEFRMTLHLPVTARVQIVNDLTDHGMSSRAIAAPLGVDHTTVLNDRRTGGEFSPPGTETTSVRVLTGLDGKRYPREQSPDVVVVEGVVVGSEEEEDAEMCRRNNITSVRQHSERLAYEVRAAVADFRVRSGNLAEHLEMIGSAMPELISLTDAIENDRRRLDGPLQDLDKTAAEFAKVIKKATKEALK